MKMYRKKECLAFDDVLIVPNKKSTGMSRLDVDLSVQIGSINMSIPIISSPMDTVTEVAMAMEIDRLGGFGVLHRFQSKKKQSKMIEELIKSKSWIVPAVGVTKEEMKRAKYLYKKYGDIIDMFSIDIANGNHILMERAVKFIQDMTGGEIEIMAGNVATHSGFKFLADLGVNAVRVGIGGGCHTKDTKVLMADGTYKNINNIFPGETVINKNGNPVPVKKVINNGFKKVIRIKTSGWNESIYVTPEHEYLCLDSAHINCIDNPSQERESKECWRSIKDIKEGGLLLTPRIINLDNNLFINTGGLTELFSELHHKLKTTNNQSFAGQAFDGKPNDYSYSNILFAEECQVEMEVWDIEVDCPTHSYIANNVIVHNSICKTRVQTGFGMPTLASVDDCAEIAKRSGVAMIADGGIKYPMDIVKSLAAGANAVMCGGILAGTKEAPGDVIYTNDGKAWKSYRGMACYSSDTEVLTRGGWKFFNQLSYKDEVATMNPDNDTLEYHIPDKIMEYNYNGDMYNIKSKFIDISVTPNHNLYVAKSNSKKNYKFKLIEAENAFDGNKSFLYKKGCNWKGGDDDLFTIPFSDISIPMKDWLYFYGFWLAEGCTYTYIQKKKYLCYVTSYSNNDLSIMKRCNKILSAAGINFSMRNRNGNYETRFHNKKFYNYLSQFGKAPDKFVDPRFMNLSTNLLENLFQGIYDGDGCKSRSCIYTTSERLKYDIAEIALKTNRVPKISLARLAGDNDGRFIRNHNLYSINVSKVGSITKVPDNGVKKAQYSGKVYCVSVRNHIIYVKRNEKMVWCGNSEAVQNEKKGGMKKGTCAEGVSTLTPYKGSLERVIDEFSGGLRSALTYNNSLTIKDLQETAEFIKITGSGLSESHAYGTNKR